MMSSLEPLSSPVPSLEVNQSPGGRKRKLFCIMFFIFPGFNKFPTFFEHAYEKTPEVCGYNVDIRETL